MVRVKAHEEFADVIADRLNKVEGIVGTSTHIAFRTYSSHDLEAAFSLGLEGEYPRRQDASSVQRRLDGSATGRGHPAFDESRGRAGVDGLCRTLHPSAQVGVEVRLRRSRVRPRQGEGDAGVEQHGVAHRARGPGEDVADDPGVVRCVAAAQVLDGVQLGGRAASGRRSAR